MHLSIDSLLRRLNKPGHKGSGEAVETDDSEDSTRKLSRSLLLARIALRVREFFVLFCLTFAIVLDSRGNRGQ